MRIFLNTLISGFLVALLFTGCAGTRDGDNGSDASEQDKELQDIEALLGITTEEEDEPERQQPPAEDEGEKLSLLEKEEGDDKDQSSSLAQASMYQEMASEEEQQEYEERITKLEQQLRQKDMEIADLKAQIQLQQEEMSSSSTRSSSSGGFSGVVSSVSTEEYESRYAEARAAFEDRNYELALQLFQSLLSASTRHSLSDNAQYWIGECHYALKQYDAAIIDFEKVFTYPNSNKNDDAQFKLGVCYLRKGDRAKATEEFERLINNFPNSEYVQRANDLMVRISG
jgi:tol-pal system protein YbgF